MLTSPRSGRSLHVAEPIRRQTYSIPFYLDRRREVLRSLPRLREAARRVTTAHRQTHSTTLSIRATVYGLPVWHQVLLEIRSPRSTDSQV